MAITPFLAMTAAEMRNCSGFSLKTAWMACHFSPYGLGLSNLPKVLPSGSVLMVDDVTPPHGHDPSLIAQQLSLCVEMFQCSWVLLDFQRVGCNETAAIAKHLTEALPCPAALSACYAKDLDCPVFLPPVPPSVPLKEHFALWNGREIWLELGLDGETLTLTETGCEAALLPHPDWKTKSFTEKQLHCQYSMEINETSARFTLWRTKEDLEELLAGAEKMGVAGTVGLYQEMHSMFL